MGSMRLGIHLAGQRAMDQGPVALVDPLTDPDFTWLMVYDAPTTFAATADATAVSSWTDRSGNARHALQATGTKQPTVRTVSGKKVVRFDNTDDCLQVASFNPAVPSLMVYAVFSAASTGDRIVAETSAAYFSNDGSFILYRTTANKVAASLNGTATSLAEWTTTATVSTTPSLVTARYDMTMLRHEMQAAIGGDINGSWTSMITGSGDQNTGNFTTNTLNIGSRNNGASLPLNGDLMHLWIAAGRHNAAQRNQVEAWLEQEAGVSRTAVVGTIVFEGDSLTEGDGNTGAFFANPYPLQVATRLTDNMDWHITAVSGQTLAQMNADYTTQISPLLSTEVSKNIVVVWGGTNDMVSVGGNQTAATTIARLWDHCDDLRTAGAQVIVLTMLPRSDTPTAPADFNTKRATVNTAIRADWASHANVLCDVAADTRIGDDGDSDNTTYYAADKVHLNATGYTIIADLVETALGTLGVT